LRPKTAPFSAVLCTETFCRNVPLSPYGNSCHLAEYFSETSVCIYYKTEGHILESSNFHIHHITYTNRSLCVSSHMRVPCLIPISDSCFPVVSQASCILQYHLLLSYPITLIKDFVSPAPSVSSLRFIHNAVFSLIVGLPQIQNCVSPIGCSFDDLSMLNEGMNLLSISH